MVFWRKKAASLPDVAPEFKLRQLCAFADALLVFYRTRRNPALGQKLISLNRSLAKRESGCLTEEELRELSYSTIEAACDYYKDAGIPFDRMKQIVTHERIYELMNKAIAEGAFPKDVQDALNLIYKLRETVGENAPNTIDGEDRYAMLKVDIANLTDEISRSLKRTEELEEKASRFSTSVLTPAEEKELKQLKEWNIKKAKGLLILEKRRDDSQIFVHGAQEGHLDILKTLDEVESDVIRYNQAREAEKNQERLNQLNNATNLSLAGYGNNKVKRLADEATARLEGMREVQADSSGAAADREFTELAAQERLKELGGDGSSK